jgi:hypothetical protein
MCIQWKWLQTVLDDLGYAMAHPRLNKVVYLQLASATVDGVAYHLVQKFEMDKDGHHAAWKNMCKWYDVKTAMGKTTVGICSKLVALQLTTSTSGSEYVNKFLAWHRNLLKIKGEGMSASHAVSVFLWNIMDPDYLTTATFCLNNKCTLVIWLSRSSPQRKGRPHRDSFSAIIELMFKKIKIKSSEHQHGQYIKP